MKSVTVEPSQTIKEQLQPSYAMRLHTRTIISRLNSGVVFIGILSPTGGAVERGTLLFAARQTSRVPNAPDLFCPRRGPTAYLSIFSASLLWPTKDRACPSASQVHQASISPRKMSCGSRRFAVPFSQTVTHGVKS